VTTRARAIRGVRLVHEGEEYAVLELTPTTLDSSPPVESGELVAAVELSTAERDIIELLARGLSNADIARARNRSTRTVANQLQKLYRKLAVTSRVELVSKLAERPAVVSVRDRAHRRAHTPRRPR
jgi:DNA-binding NarL/FixJ family response regulator